MRIGFDGRVLERKMTGIGRYLLNILEELPKWDYDNKYYLFTNKKQSFCQDEFYEYRILNYPLINSKIFTPLWLNFLLPRMVEKEKIEVLIGPNILVPTKRISNCYKISIVHDILPLTHPEFFPFSYRKFLEKYLPLSINASDLIITISEASKISIIDYFGTSEKKIKVVYNTVSRKFRVLSSDELSELESKVSFKLPDKFLLYVGVIEKRKNIEMLLKIAEHLNQIDKNLKLILAGKPGYKFKEFENGIKKLRDQLIYLNQVKDDELLYLYNKAIALIFPSFVEGFGLPPIEAMACGTPVIASNCDALSEIVGDAGFLINPKDFDGFINSIKRIFHDQEFYSKLVNKSLERAKIFSKENMIKSFLTAINKRNLSESFNG